MICFHGTTSKGLAAIKANDGFKPNNPWCCSDNDGAMYVWPTNKLDEPDELEIGIRMGFESAQVQAVTSNDFELYVLVIDVPDEILEDDYSAENMESSASYLNMTDFDYAMVKKIYTVKMNPWHSPFVLSGLLNNDHFNKYSVDEALLAVAKNVADVFIDEIYDFDYEDFGI